MAVPTIISVTPSEVVANSRAQVVIAGTNFNMWPSLPWPNGGVFVYFVFGVEEFLANYVQVISDTEIRCEIVRFMGDSTATTLKADVKVINLDVNGDPVPGEEATLADAVTYYKDQHMPGDKNPGEDFLTLCVREAIKTFKRSTDVPVAVATHIDWFEEGQLEHFTAELPCIAFTGFGLESIPHTPYDPDRDREEGDDEEHLASEYFWITWQVAPMAEGVREIMGLWQMLIRMSQRVRQLFVPKAHNSTDRMTIKFILDASGELGFNYGVGTGTATLSARMGPIPLETPEVTNRLGTVQEAFLHATNNIEGTGDARDTQFYTP